MAKKSTKYLLITFLIVLCLILLLLYLKRNTPPPPPTTQTTENFDYLPASSAYPTVQHDHFVLAYAEQHEQAAWVAYELTLAEVSENTERSDDFREDPSITTGSATPDDYRRSGYDRGHLAPAGDMGFTESAMSESFFMSNISPQSPAFNRGIWKNLEEDVRNWVRQTGRLYVVTGPVFADSQKKIGENQVTVPSYFFKILLDYREPDIKMIGFLLPNEGTQQSLTSFAVPVDEIEKITGLDFFPALPDAIENDLEARVQTAGWFN